MMATRTPVWMWVALGVQLALALAGIVAIIGLADGMAGHAVAFAHDDVPMLFPALAVIVLGAAALLLRRNDRRTLATILTLAPFPVAAVLMAWAWM